MQDGEEWAPDIQHNNTQHNDIFKKKKMKVTNLKMFDLPKQICK